MHKKAVEEKIEELEKYMEKINYKVWYYETAVKAGTEKVHWVDK